MKKIKLTKGQEAIVDDNDFETLKSVSWCVVNGTNSLYAGRNEKTDDRFRTVLMHRVILEAKRGDIVDHKNGNTLDNRKKNLRFCSPAQSVCNRGMMKNNTSGFVGAIFNKRLGKFESRISLNGKSHYLGIFETAEAAGQAHARVAKRLHGKFANISTK